MSHERSFRTAFVCTGNRFRSPLASAIFRTEAQRLGAPVEVESFGLLDLDGSPALAEALELGGSLGVELSSHRSRVLQPASLEACDLVVGFERAHVAAAVVDAAARREVTYTLPELVNLLASVPVAAESDPVAAARALIHGASAKRAERRGLGDVPELDDPLGLPRRTQEQLATRLAELTRALALGLFAR